MYMHMCMDIDILVHGYMSMLYMSMHIYILHGHGHGHHPWGAQAFASLTRSRVLETPPLLQLINNQLPLEVICKYAALFHSTVNKRVVGELLMP